MVISLSALAPCHRNHEVPLTTTSLQIRCLVKGTLHGEPLQVSSLVLCNTGRTVHIMVTPGATCRAGCISIIAGAKPRPNLHSVTDHPLVTKTSSARMSGNLHEAPKCNYGFGVVLCAARSAVLFVNSLVACSSATPAH